MVTKNKLIGTSTAALAAIAAGAFMLTSPPDAAADDGGCYYAGQLYSYFACIPSYCGPNYNAPQQCNYIPNVWLCGCS